MGLRLMWAVAFLAWSRPQFVRSLGHTQGVKNRLQSIIHIMQGIPGAPHWHARSEIPQGRSLCVSHTQRASPQRLHFGLITGETVHGIGHVLVISRDLEHFVAQFDTREYLCNHAALLRALPVVLAVAIVVFCHGAHSYAELVALYQ